LDCREGRAKHLRQKIRRQGDPAGMAGTGLELPLPLAMSWKPSMRP
jgi:hypothetical protein